jgi:hypothetical protein
MVEVASNKVKVASKVVEVEVVGAIVPYTCRSVRWQYPRSIERWHGVARPTTMDY